MKKFSRNLNENFTQFLRKFHTIFKRISYNFSKGFAQLLKEFHSIFLEFHAIFKTISLNIREFDSLCYYKKTLGEVLEKSQYIFFNFSQFSNLIRYTAKTELNCLKLHLTKLWRVKRRDKYINNITKKMRYQTYMVGLQKKLLFLYIKIKRIITTTTYSSILAHANVACMPYLTASMNSYIH